MGALFAFSKRQAKRKHDAVVQSRFARSKSLRILPPISRPHALVGELHERLLPSPVLVPQLPLLPCHSRSPCDDDTLHSLGSMTSSSGSTATPPPMYTSHDPLLAPWLLQGSSAMAGTAADGPCTPRSYDLAYGRIVSRLDALLAKLDGIPEREAGPVPEDAFELEDGILTSDRSLLSNVTSPFAPRAKPQRAKSSSIFLKPNLYANAHLPSALPRFTLQLPYWPLVALAAKHALAVYSPPPSTHGVSASPQITLHVPAAPGHPKSLTKALTLATTTHPSSTSSSILVVAIRGSHSLSDWRTNFRQAPQAPEGFLEDEGNLCHQGFLNVARSMANLIYEQLISPRFNFVLDQDGASPRSFFGKSKETKWTLILTGHSAGGAVALLIYQHLLSAPHISSHLKALAKGIFGRVHCFTFGAPPVSLLPILPVSPHPKHATKSGHYRDWRKKSIFLAFVNEGDPICRADNAYARSLVSLYTTSAPPPGIDKPLWPVPTTTFSLAGRLVVLRPPTASSSSASQAKQSLANRLTKKKSKMTLSGESPPGAAHVDKSPSSTASSLEAVVATDADMRHLVYGNPEMHSMILYKQRIDMMAMNAVTGGFGDGRS